MATYNPGFKVGERVFKKVGQPAWGYNGWITPEYIGRMAKARPDLFNGIEDPAKLVTPYMMQGESTGVQQGYELDPKLMAVLGQYQLQRRGVEGIKDGRTNAFVDAQGNLVYADTPYGYDPAGDTLKSLGELGMLAGAAFGGLGLAGHGPLAGALGGSGGGAAAATAGEAGAGGMLSGLDAAALDAGAGAVAGGAEAAGAAGAGAGAASGGALNAAAIESLAGTAGYGANAAADLFASSVGAGASGAGVSAFDSALAAIKNVGLNAVGAVSPGAASSLASGGDWLSQTFSAITGGSGTGGSLLGGLFSGSSALRDILGLVGAGVQQYNLEKMAKDNREWASAEKAKERRRQMPVTGAGLLGNFRVIPSGAGNGG